MRREEWKEQDVRNDQKWVDCINTRSFWGTKWFTDERERKNAKELKDGISLVKKYEDLLKGPNRKIINIVGKQGELLKRFKDSE